MNLDWTNVTSDLSRQLKHSYVSNASAGARATDVGQNNLDNALEIARRVAYIAYPLQYA